MTETYDYLSKLYSLGPSLSFPFLMEQLQLKPGMFEKRSQQVRLPFLSPYGAFN